MVKTQSREQKKVNKNQGHYHSQKSEADDDLHEKQRMISARTCVRCESTNNNFEELDQGYI